VFRGPQSIADDHPDAFFGIQLLGDDRSNKAAYRRIGVTVCGGSMSPYRRYGVSAYVFAARLFILSFKGYWPKVLIKKVDIWHLA
jgi:hypothetical protein